jgi:polysaccharide biosynthesis protein PslE
MGGFAIQPGTRSIDALTVRDAVAPVFRQRRLAGAIFIGIFGGAVLAAAVLPARYRAEMKILVNRDRADDVVTPNPDTRIVSTQAPSVTEQDLNSEVELLKSRDLLRNVALACNLESQPTGWWGSIGQKWGRLHSAEATRRRQIARAVDALDRKIIAEPLKDTSLIQVTYTSKDAQLSARVLQTLATLYQQKHAEVHRPAGAFHFFERQANYYGSQLAVNESRLQRFDTANGLADPEIQEQLTLQQISRLQAKLDEDRAGIRAARDRTDRLKQEQSASPQRQTTVIRTSGNAELVAQLSSTLLSLELKRREMLAKYAPDYPLVLETNAQIADARKALANAQQTPVEEVTTDRTPAQDWIATEMTRAEADRVGLEAEASSVSRDLLQLNANAMRINRESAEQGDLVRNVKTAEENYLLYVRKREEARISDLLDQKRIVNVSVAEAATVPAFPIRNWPWILAFGLFGAGAASIGAAYAADRLDSTFHSPDDLGRYLDLRVLAAIPERSAEVVKRNSL